MKRIISIVLAVIIAIMPISAAATDGKPNVIIEKLANMTPQMRSQYIAMLRPFLTTDAGVAAGIDNLKSGMFESMLGVSFTPEQEDVLVRTFRSFSCIKENTGIRLKYADIFQNKIPAVVADETKSGINKLIDAVGKSFPLIDKIIKEDGYTAEVVANMLKVLPEINGSAAVCFENGEFYTADTNSDFEKEFDAVWADFSGMKVSAYNLLEKTAALFNQVPQTDRLLVAKALENLGVCKIVGDGTVPPSATTKETEHYVVVDYLPGVAKSVFENSVVIKTKTNLPKTVDVLVESENPMIYKLVGASMLEPVKKSVPTDTGIMAVLEPETAYVIKTVAYPFTDANGWGKSYIAALYARGIVNGKSSTEFMPETPITREEFIKLVVELFDLVDENAVCRFRDVPKGVWYEKYVASAHAAGITDGVGDGKFGSGAPITRQDMAKIINTILISNGIKLSGDGRKFRDEASIADYAKTHVFAISGHIISGDDTGKFNPLKKATRQEAAKMVFGMLKLYIS